MKMHCLSESKHRRHLPHSSKVSRWQRTLDRRQVSQAFFFFFASAEAMLKWVVRVVESAQPSTARSSRQHICQFAHDKSAVSDLLEIKSRLCEC